MAYGTSFICKQQQEAICWDGNACTESACIHKEKLWMRMGVCKLVLLKNEVTYNWVMDHNTLKNYSTSG